MAIYHLDKVKGKGWKVSAKLAKGGKAETVAHTVAADKAEVFAVMKEMATFVADSRPKQLKFRLGQVNSGGQQ